MKIHDVPQGDISWFKLRLGIPTASGFGEIMKLDFTPRDSDGFKTYLYARVAERALGTPLPGFGGSWDTEQGTMRESEARPFFEFETGLTTQTVGFITTDDGLAGCSPDALVGEQAGLEIKCPRAETHVKYLMRGEVPPEYSAQVHGSLYVTGRKEWHFLSYHRGLRPLHVVVKRDEAIMEQIGKTLAHFHQKFTEALAKVLPEQTA